MPNAHVHAPLVLAWLLLGMAVLTLDPALRYNARFGATLPFWLVGAPAINLAWIMRARISSAWHNAWTSLRALRARPQARRASRAQSALRLRPERSSRK
jgi:hypothetical protein